MTRPRPRHAVLRLVVMVVAGIAAALATGLWWRWQLAPVIGWAAAAAVFSAWVWIIIARQDADSTRKHATLEEPAREVADALVVLLTIASLGSLGFTLVPAAHAEGAERFALAGLGLVNVALSWLLLHTLFTLRYARLYYGDVIGGIDFNDSAAPRYSDFAYFSFTIGMTFQVSDASITDHALRMTALRHALLSFVFGSVILASTVNLVAGLGS